MYRQIKSLHIDEKVAKEIFVKTRNKLTKRNFVNIFKIYFKKICNKRISFILITEQETYDLS